MRKLTAGVLVGLLATASLTQPAQAQPTTDLRPALLTTADLPAGFVPVAAATDTDGAVSLGGDFPGCPSLHPLTGAGTTAAAVTFSKGFAGPYVTDAAVRFPAGAAAAAMDHLAEALTSCGTFDSALGGFAVRFTLTGEPVPANLGARAIGLRMTGTTDFGIAVTADIVAVRRGDVVLWLNDMTVGSAPAGLVAGLAPVAAARCAQHVTGC